MPENVAVATQRFGVLGRLCGCVRTCSFGGTHVGLWRCLSDDAFPNVCAKDGRKYFPPTVPMVLSWSMGFRVRGTFVNYLGYVRTGCLVAGCSVQAFSDPAVLRAKLSINDAVDFERRPPMFLQQPLVRALVVLGRERPEFETYSMLFLCTYVFLLRLPSEALPLLAHGGDFSLASGDAHGSRVLVLSLKRRKNRPRGSRLSRGCWCKKDKDTCPVHVLLPWLLRLPPGATLFPGISPWGALRTMRRMLVILEVPDAGKYCVHDFRRGHALDLQLSGACLS